MITESFHNGATTNFQLRRPIITAGGYVSEIDRMVKSHLDELNVLLGKAVFARSEPRYIETAAEAAPPPEPEAEIGRSKGRSRPRRRPLRVEDLTELALTPKRVPDNTWSAGSLLDVLSTTEESDDLLTLENYIDADKQLSELKYGLDAHLESAKFTLPINVKAVVEGHPAIVDYLVVYGARRFGVQDVNGLINALMKHPAGVKSIINYAAVSAARSRIDLEQLAVPDANDDDSAIVEKLIAANLPFSALSFSTSADKVVDQFIFNSKEEDLLDDVEAEIGPIPASVRPSLIAYIKSSPFPITTANAKYFVPHFLSHLNGGTAGAGGTTTMELSTLTQPQDSDFDVTYLEFAAGRAQVSASAVRCAAQLFYAMVLADDLDVFNAVNFFTHRMCLREGIDLTDLELRADLHQYVFDNEFPEVKPVPSAAGVKWERTGRVFKRTRPAERQMFYRQVFNHGAGAVPEDLVINNEFKTMWKVLMLESARYLERAQISPHPDSFVSRTNVMQAAEDLQYNLSTHAVGMASVIAPLIYKELEFVVHRILEHDVVIKRVLPEGGEWWRVVEALALRMNKARPKARVLNNKAKLGHAIIKSLADYDPSTFENDKNFSAFISNVDAFITTQSILQEALTDSLKKMNGEAEEEEEEGMPRLQLRDSEEGMPGTMPMPIPAPGAGGPGEAAGSADEWDF